MKTASGGIARCPGFADAVLPTHAFVGDRRNDEVYYRDAAVYCTAGTFLSTNAYAIVRAP
ncbi:MAG: hypothetical protein ACKVWV_10480 [Planctomycetota bacterium]